MASNINSALEKKVHAQNSLALDFIRGSLNIHMGYEECLLASTHRVA